MPGEIRRLLRLGVLFGFLLQLMASRDDRQELTKKVQYTMDAVSVLKSQVARLVSDFVYHFCFYNTEFTRFCGSFFSLPEPTTISTGGLWKSGSLGKPERMERTCF